MLTFSVKTAISLGGKVAVNRRNYTPSLVTI